MAALIAAFALSIGTAAHADVTDHQTKGLVYELAFDPDRNFWGDGQPFLTLLHRGDDWGVPVYSLGIAEVDGVFIARMVRSTPGRDEERPRAAGYRLYAAVDKAKAKSRSALQDLFDSGAVEWLETDLARCTGGLEAVDAVHRAQWTVHPDSARQRKFGDPENAAPIVIHADTVRVRYRSYLQNVEYDGWFTDREAHVSTAVLALEKTLKPCWKPALSTAPWHREPAKD